MVKKVCKMSVTRVEPLYTVENDVSVSHDDGKSDDLNNNNDSKNGDTKVKMER